MVPVSWCTNVCNIKETYRFDCIPECNATKNECLSRGCCWKLPSNMDVPYCFYGDGNFGYEVWNATDTPNGFVLDLNLRGPGGQYRGNVKRLKAEFRLESHTRLHVKVCVPMGYLCFYSAILQ